MGDQVSCRRVSAVCVPPEDEFNIPRLRGDVNVEKFFAAGRPAILTDVLNKWPCKDWSLDWLSATLGHHSVEVSYKDCCGNVEGKEKMTLSRFLSEFAAPRSDFNQGPVPYVSNFDVFGLMPELREQLPASELFSARRSLVIYGGFLGPSASVTRIHVDSEDNIISCIFGRKLFVLLPPSAKELMNFDARDIPIKDPWDPAVADWVRHHPLFARCADAVQTIVLRAGEVFIQPKGWSHWVHNMELSFSVACWAKEVPVVEAPPAEIDAT